MSAILKPPSEQWEIAWRGFAPGTWQHRVNLRDFIQRNYTPYEGDGAFLAGPTQRTRNMWQTLQPLLAKEREKGVLDVSQVPSGILAHAPGYIDKANEIIVGLKVGPAHSQFECLNTFYRVTDRSLMFRIDNVEYWLLVFAGDVNVPALAASYAALTDVAVAEPNYWSVGENIYRPTDLGNGTWVWDIDDGFMDCIDGCDCHRLYLFETHAEGEAMLLGQNKQGAGWCGQGGPSITHGPAGPPARSHPLSER